MSDANTVFAGWLRSERERLGISQERLPRLLSAADFPVTQQYLTNVERGYRKEIPLSFVVAVAEVLGVTPDVTLGLTGGESAVAAITCPACKGAPPAGFTCNACGGEA
ncbi:hypothetical protein ADL27_59155 [Streptomyces sp. NRRL F-6602]|nr:hypothetical protein ADL27_59155 [Streptomyces sp. NRRL F-6602]